MQILASIWDGDSWATDGGRTKIDWNHAPFYAQFQGFNIDGCSSDSSTCSSPNLWWNAGSYRELNPAQKAAYQHVKEKYMTYDYCDDRKRYPTPPPECYQ